MKKSLLILFTFSSTFAWNLFSSPPVDDIKKAEYQAPKIYSKPPVCLSKRQQVLKNRHTCPAINELYKKGMRWRTDSAWKGYQDSFAEKIVTFKGAQWKGVGIGRVICIYGSNDSNEFDIQIANSSLIKRPYFAYWENNTSKDVINCLSKRSNPCDCQFSFYVEEKETDLDVIIQGIKKK